MERDEERIERIKTALRQTGLDAMVCVVPENVLLLSGYFPVVGTSVAVATVGGRSTVLAPEDERDLAESGWAHEVRTYAPGSVTRLIGPEEAVQQPLAALLHDLGVAEGKLGYEDQAIYQGASYAAMYQAQISVPRVLAAVAPLATVTSGATPISQLRSALSEREVGCVRRACRIAGDAFCAAAREIRPGRREPEVASAFEGPMMICGLVHPQVRRTRAFTWCMSGPNSAFAGAAYARTRDRQLRDGDLVLVHCNSYVDGYWTDITRTFCLGEPDERQQSMYEAIFAARAAALQSIRPGVKAADVDSAARDVLKERGFGEYFTHGLGHNVGFSTISAEFPPRIHPASPDRLETGMTFNVEPAIYIKGYGGTRHCDVVTVHEDGAEVLTPFQSEVEQLVCGVG